jgi:5-methylcytosine-specific restriction endonuclease McrA
MTSRPQTQGGDRLRPCECRLIFASLKRCRRQHWGHKISRPSPSAAYRISISRAPDACAYCGAVDRPLQRDCVLPLSRGGRYTLGNIVPACESCNASKCNDEVAGWLRRRRFDERTFLVRHLEIQTALALQFPAIPNADAEAAETTALRQV